MSSLQELLQQGTAHAWLFIPTAIVLGALHGLEPGHSKTMMAAFIIAIRGTVAQAVLLGVSAALSHTAVVWIVALGGQYLGRGFAAEAIEPYLQLASGAIVAGVAVWMMWRTYRDQQSTRTHTHDHGHDDEVRRIDTGHGVMALEVFEQGVPPRWRLHFEGGQRFAPNEVTLVTERAEGTRQAFALVDRGDYLESVEAIPEPHAFKAQIRLGHGDHTHSFDAYFAEHDHTHEDHEGLRVGDGEYVDAHEQAHADDIERRFANRQVTTGQLVMFGLTGGLIPCPAAVTVLLLCLQLREIALGVTLVAFFSLGLALTMVLVGVGASLSVKHVQKRWSGLSVWAGRAPYASSVLMLVIAIYMVVAGWNGLVGGAH